jgi:hypothetical protein
VLFGFVKCFIKYAPCFPKVFCVGSKCFGEVKFFAGSECFVVNISKVSVGNTVLVSS